MFYFLCGFPYLSKIKIKYTYSIRIGVPDDALEIAQLLVKVWQQAYTDFLPADFLIGMNIDSQEKRHYTYLNSGTSYYLAENQEQQLIGFASYGKNRFKDFNFDFELYTIYVDPDLQGLGIGQTLLNEILGSISEGFISLGVSVFEKNPYRSFYEKNDFRVIGKEIIDFGKFKERCIVYEKSIK